MLAAIGSGCDESDTAVLTKRGGSVGSGNGGEPGAAVTPGADVGGAKTTRGGRGGITDPPAVGERDTESVRVALLERVAVMLVDAEIDTDAEIGPANSPPANVEVLDGGLDADLLRELSNVSEWLGDRAPERDEEADGFGVVERERDKVVDRVCVGEGVRDEVADGVCVGEGEGDEVDVSAEGSGRKAKSTPLQSIGGVSAVLAPGKWLALAPAMKSCVGVVVLPIVPLHCSDELTITDGRAPDGGIVRQSPNGAALSVVTVVLDSK